MYRNWDAERGGQTKRPRGEKRVILRAADTDLLGLLYMERVLHTTATHVETINPQTAWKSINGVLSQTVRFHVVRHRCRMWWLCGSIIALRPNEKEKNEKRKNQQGKKERRHTSLGTAMDASAQTLHACAEKLRYFK